MILLNLCQGAHGLADCCIYPLPASHLWFIFLSSALASKTGAIELSPKSSYWINYSKMGWYILCCLWIKTHSYCWSSLSQCWTTYIGAYWIRKINFSACFFFQMQHWIQKYAKNDQLKNSLRYSFGIYWGKNPLFLE